MTKLPNYQFTKFALSIFELHHRHTTPALVGWRGREPRDQRVLLQKSGERALQLAGAVAVDQAQHALIGQQRLVEEPLRARQRLVHGAADDIQIRRRRFTRLQLDVHIDARRRRRAADHLQIADAGAHPLAADVEIGGAIVNRGDGRFEAEAADDDAGTDRDQAGRQRLGAGNLCCRTVVGARGDRVDRGSRIAARLAGIAGRDQAWTVRNRVGFRFQIGDDLIDLLARGAHLRLELLVQPPLEGLFALTQRVLAVVHLRLGRLQRLALARGEAVLVLEGAHVVIDLGEVLGELRFAGAEVFARRSD